MSTTLFKRTAATVAAFIAIGSTGAMSLPAVAAAATTHPAASQNAHAAQAQHYPGYWCGHWHSPVWCYPGYPPNVYPPNVHPSPPVGPVYPPYVYPPPPVGPGYPPYAYPPRYLPGGPGYRHH